MAAENRLTAEQLAALAPGDTVTIETSGDFRRPRLASGVVARIDGSHLAVRVRGPRGSTFLEQYQRRDGTRVGGLSRAELVQVDDPDSVDQETRRRMRQIDQLYREWSRQRSDMDKLRALHDAIAECLSVTSEH